MHVQRSILRDKAFQLTTFRNLHVTAGHLPRVSPRQAAAAPVSRNTRTRLHA